MHKHLVKKISIHFLLITIEFVLISVKNSFDTFFYSSGYEPYLAGIFSGVTLHLLDENPPYAPYT